jgi:hypothetical protein
VDSLRKEYGFIEKFKVWFGRKSVIVFTMGKVGTLTVCNSLREAGYKHVHPHSLRYTKPGIHFLKIKLSFFNKIKFTFKTLLKRVKVFFWKLTKQEIYVITGVRDPFSRNVSAYFEQLHYLGGLGNRNTFDQISTYFNETCDFEAPIHWFDKEILQVTGINVYETPFDKQKGYSIINKGKYKLFVYRIDKLNTLENELAEFIGEDRFKLLSTNISDEGEYSQQLKLLKNNYKYQQEITDTFVDSLYMKHFFSESEIDNLKNKWAKLS